MSVQLWGIITSYGDVKKNIDGYSRNLEKVWKFCFHYTSMVSDGDAMTHVHLTTVQKYTLKRKLKKINNVWTM